MKKNPKTWKSCLSDQMCDMYRSDAIYAQPTNTRIQLKSIDEIIKEGAELMKNDGFILGGKEIDV